MKKKGKIISALSVLGLFFSLLSHSELIVSGKTLNLENEIIKTESKGNSLLSTKEAYVFPKTPRQVLNLKPKAEEIDSSIESKSDIPGEYSFYIDNNKTTTMEILSGKYEKVGNWYRFLSKDNMKEDYTTTIKLKYKNIGVYEGKQITMIVDVVRMFDLAKPEEDGGLNIVADPVKIIDFNMRSLAFFEAKYSFYDSEDQPIELKGYMTFSDNDGDEIVGASRDNNNIENVYLHAKPNIIAQDNGNWTLSKAQKIAAEGIETPESFATYTFDGTKDGKVGTTFKFIATAESRLDRTDYVAGANTWSNSTQTTGLKSRPTALAKPTKIITDKDEEAVLENTLVDIDEELTYTIRQQIPYELKEWRYTSYVVEDTLPKLLSQTEKIKIINARTEEDLTTKFTETRTEVAGSTKLSWALKDSLNSDLYGQEFEIIIPAKIKTESDLTEFIVGEKLQFKNVSTTEAISKTTSGEVKQKETSNEAITNSPLPARVKIIKKDKATDSSLKGAEFELKQGDKVIKKGITNDKGEVLLSNFPKGKYTITETKAPAGYLKDSKNQDVTIDSNVLQEKIPTFTFYDTVIQPKPKLTKTSDVNKVVLGQTFSYKITALNEEELALWNGVVVTDEVPSYLEIDESKITVTEGKLEDVTVTGNKVTWKAGNITTKTHVLTLPVKVIKVPSELELINKAKATGKLVNGEVTKELEVIHKLPVDYDAGKLKVTKDILLIDGNKPVIDPETKHYNAKIGSKLNYQIIAENTGNANSIIRNVSITDTLEAGLDYQENVKVTDKAGKEISATIKYDEKTRVLSIVPKTALDLKEKEQLIVSFDVTINESARGSIKNTGIAKGKIPSVNGEKDITESGDTSNDIINDPYGELTKSVDHITEHKNDSYFYRNEVAAFKATYQSLMPDSIFYLSELIEDLPKELLDSKSFKVVVVRGESGEIEEYTEENDLLVVEEIEPTTSKYATAKKITFKDKQQTVVKKGENMLKITGEDKVMLTYTSQISATVMNGQQLGTVTTIHGLNYAEEEVIPKSAQVVLNVKTGILELVQVANLDYGEQDMQKSYHGLPPTIDKPEMVIVEDGRPDQSGFGIHLQMASLFSINGDGATDTGQVSLFYETDTTEIVKETSVPVISVSKEEEIIEGKPIFQFKRNLDAGNNELYVNTSPFTKGKVYQSVLEWNLNELPTNSKRIYQ